MLCKYEKHYTNEKEDDELEKHDEATGEDGTAAIRLIARSEEALNDSLVGAVGGHGQEASANDSGPKGIGFAEAPGEIQEPQLMTVERGDLRDFRPTPGNFVQQQSERDQA